MPLASLSVHPVPSLAGSWVLMHLRCCAPLSLEGEPSFGDLKSPPGCLLASGLLGLFTWPFSFLSSAEFLLQSTDLQSHHLNPSFIQLTASSKTSLASLQPPALPEPISPPCVAPHSPNPAEQQGTNAGTLLPSERGWCCFDGSNPSPSL